MTTQKLMPIHPGRILLEEFLAPARNKRLALGQRHRRFRAARIRNRPGQRPINANIAHSLAHYFGMSERYWLELQARYDGKQADKLPTMFPRKQSLRYVR